MSDDGRPCPRSLASKRTDSDDATIPVGERRVDAGPNFRLTVLVLRNQPLALNVYEMSDEKGIVLSLERGLMNWNGVVTESAKKQAEIRGDVFVKQEGGYATASSNAIARFNNSGSTRYASLASCSPTSRETPKMKHVSSAVPTMLGWARFTRGVMKTASL